VASKLPDPFILSPPLVNPDGTEQRGSRRDVLTPWRAIVEWTRLYRLAPNLPYFRRFNQHASQPPVQPSPINVVSGAVMLMKRDTFVRLQGFDEHYFLHVEDIDICVRLLRSQGSAWICPQVRLVHHGSSSRVSPIFVEWHKMRGFTYYIRKHFSDAYPAPFVWLVRLAVRLRFVVQLPLLLVHHVVYLRKRRPRAPSGADVERSI